MRVNHVGEVCAQALYRGQAAAAQDNELRSHLLRAAEDEADHLAWTATRVRELGSHTSWLNPAWYAGAFVMGWLAGRCGDAWSLGFVHETEHQVEQHLASHLERLPQADQASRAMLEKMRQDEARHADQALAAGARPLPAPVPILMRTAARFMTTVAHHI